MAAQGTDDSRAGRLRRGTRRSATVAAGTLRLLGRWLLRVTLVVLGLMLFGNVVLRTTPGQPNRALAASSPLCVEDRDAGWDILSRPVGAKSRTNDEWGAIDAFGSIWRSKLACVRQHHLIPGFTTADGRQTTLGYDLSFIEFQEDGKPYATRIPCRDDEAGCKREGDLKVRLSDRSQLADVLQPLADRSVPHYVMVFIHGWRHDASIGDSNVGDFRHYAAHAARFLEDRAQTDPRFVKPKVTAIFIGWRGARTDETWLRRTAMRWLGDTVGEAVGGGIGTFSAVLTLFDRKPVSEAVAPSVLSALRLIEHTLGVDAPLADPTKPPAAHANRMIVFGHSLGGNMLATALEDDLVKKTLRHAPGTYMLPTLGDLVVLINPASEAEKWLAVQRTVWDQIAMGNGERRPVADYIASHRFFRRDQRPIVVSVTAARDWPPGGHIELDCTARPGTTAEVEAASKVEESREIALQSPEYDWATYDLFPAFKGDFRPFGDRLIRYATGKDPHDQCAAGDPSRLRRALLAPIGWIGRLMRILPFQQTDPEQTRTIGHLDPPRAVRGTRSALGETYFSARPLGTTHELRGRSRDQVQRKWSDPNPSSGAAREIPITYSEIVGPNAGCPVTTGWLERVRAVQTTKRSAGGELLYPNATFWSSDEAGPQAPALDFHHGFQGAKLDPITRANDPFWNVRAFDTALARHDGYMLSSFICAMNGLVMDEITTFAPQPAAKPLEASPTFVGAAP